MKRLVNFVIILLYTCFSANAITRPETDYFLKFVENHTNKTAEITGHIDSWAGDPLPSNLVLPSYHIPSYPEERYEVIGFYGNSVFRGCSQIKSIAIPRSYETIPTTTFADCENLQLFSWASGSSEGRGGDRLIEDGILYSLYPYFDSSYGIWKMFCYPAGKTDIEFQVPTKCNSIGEYCFYKQRHLRTILFHDKLKNIEDYSFYGCNGLLSLTIPNGVSKLGVSAFEDCLSLEAVTIPASVAKIDKRAFAGCTKLNTITIENGVETIDSEAFANCTSLETIIIPASVTTINERAFAECTNLKTVILQSGTRKYGADVFDGCNSLNEVRIVDLSGWCQSEFVTPLANPAYLSKKLNYLGEIITDLVIPETVHNLGQNVFYGYTPLLSIIFHDNISSVSKDAFADCENISKIIIPDLVSWCKIDFITEKSNPLYYAKNLYLNDTPINTLNIPDGIEKVNQYTFVNGNFTEIWIPSTITEIADAAFKGIGPRSIRSYNLTPPSTVNTAFSNYSATLYVPVESRASYWSHTVWGMFNQIEDMPIDAVSISFEKSEYELNVNESLCLNVSFNPIQTTNKEITWSSSDEEIATIKDGVVTALKKGNIIITATTINNKSASCSLTIKEVLANTISISPMEMELKPGATATLVAQIMPENTTNQLIEWSSKDHNIVTVDQNGLIKALSLGTTQITASTLDGSNLSAICLITVSPIKISSILLNPASAEGKEGEQIQINATILPEDATNKALTWSSSDESVAIVDDNGLVSLLKEGTAIITASATDESGVAATCNISVLKPLVFVSSISLNASSAEGKEGDQIQINATILPEGATNKTIKWESSDETVATVDDNGLVSLLKEGTTTITASATDGSEVTAACNISVLKPEVLVSSILLNPLAAEGEEGEKIQINAEVLPEDATNKTISWGSSDENVASVDGTGLISLLKKGTAIITASATDESGVSAECAVVVTEYSGIEDILTDKNTYVKIFNLSGILIYEGMYSDANLVPDYYIVVCDGRNIKVKVQ